MLKEFLTFGYFDLEGLMLRDLFIRLMLKESFLSYLMLKESFNLFYLEGLMLKDLPPSNVSLFAPFRWRIKSFHREDSNGNSK